MNILNKEELRRQIREGKEISLDGILEEFKSLLRESLQTASEEELTSHLGYEKHQESENSNYRNGHSRIFITFLFYFWFYLKYYNYTLL